MHCSDTSIESVMHVISNTSIFGSQVHHGGRIIGLHIKTVVVYFPLNGAQPDVAYGGRVSHSDGASRARSVPEVRPHLLKHAHQATHLRVLLLGAQQLLHFLRRETDVEGDALI